MQMLRNKPCGVFQRPHSTFFEVNNNLRSATVLGESALVQAEERLPLVTTFR